MNVIAVVCAEDDWDNPEILLGYEDVIDEFTGNMYLGIAVEEGKDDVIFAYVQDYDDLEGELESRWGSWDTFEYLEVPMTDEEYWNENSQSI